MTCCTETGRERAAILPDGADGIARTSRSWPATPGGPSPLRTWDAPGLRWQDTVSGGRSGAGTSGTRCPRNRVRIHRGESARRCALVRWLSTATRRGFAEGRLEVASTLLEPHVRQQALDGKPSRGVGRGQWLGTPIAVAAQLSERLRDLHPLPCARRRLHQRRRLRSSALPIAQVSGVARWSVVDALKGVLERRAHAVALRASVACSSTEPSSGSVRAGSSTTRRLRTSASAPCGSISCPLPRRAGCSPRAAGPGSAQRPRASRRCGHGGVPRASAVPPPRTGRRRAGLRAGNPPSARQATL
jgi:hypothetical protein